MIKKFNDFINEDNSSSSFLKLLNDNKAELQNHPCWILEFDIELSHKSKKEFVVMEVAAGSSAAREMTKDFSEILGKKVYVYKHPLGDFSSRRAQSQTYIVSQTPIKDLWAALELEND